eukprot:TRINITY_DN4032_c0_g1_i1.p1 TRINITY_DN4032_c0_g1~~TRINITY_DN4032_c0_g1_i1.p1  ORF type:complete len:300 (+),score=85.98 TRINITY_DN4032_c0_g1_i1:90-989(+)
MGADGDTNSAPPGSSPEIEKFLKDNGPIDPRVADALRAATKEAQAVVLERGALTDCKSPSGALMSRIKNAGGLSSTGQSMAELQGDPQAIWARICAKEGIVSPQQQMQQQMQQQLLRQQQHMALVAQQQQMAYMQQLQYLQMQQLQQQQALMQPPLMPGLMGQQPLMPVQPELGAGMLGAPVAGMAPGIAAPLGQAAGMMPAPIAHGGAASMDQPATMLPPAMPTGIAEQGLPPQLQAPLAPPQGRIGEPVSPMPAESLTSPAIQTTAVLLPQLAMGGKANGMPLTGSGGKGGLRASPY